MNAIPTHKLASDIITEAEERLSELYGGKISLSVNDIQQAIMKKYAETAIEVLCGFWRITTSQFKSKLRNREMVNARKMFAAMCKDKFGRDMSLVKIGSYMANRDHSSVIHLIKEHNNHSATEESWNQDYTEIVNLIEERLKPVNEK